jgi:ABC-type metal ion transport system substrate-binding protein
MALLTRAALNYLKDLIASGKDAIIKGFQCIRLKIKQYFCDHDTTEAEITENPQPLVFLEVKAKCSKCGIASFEIKDKYLNNYKIRLADDVLLQRNIEKFPQYYMRNL